ncbi:Atu4866 domain-containing protein [Actinoplanes sp. NPDC026619]|uniref:Atu4866 domain-containing protein n=1 Tax=Actinoplanes sp. NPDC026619 TaxID=3155798 RepID=UPI0033C05FB6
MRPQSTTVLDANALLALVMGGSAAEPGPKPARVMLSAPVGLWLSEDGTVRLDIKTDGTYDGQVAGRRRRAHGTYHIDGALMTLSDHDSGLHTPVALYDGELEMAGHRLGLAH